MPIWSLRDKLNTKLERQKRSIREQSHCLNDSSMLQGDLPQGLNMDRSAQIQRGSFTPFSGPTTFQPPTNTCSFQVANMCRIWASLLLTRISWLRGLSRFGL